MTDEIKHYGDPIEFCGDQEGWIAVASLTDESPNSPCHPRVVLLGVGLGPSGKMHPSNIAAMLTVEQATDLRERLTAATAVDRPAPTPTPAPGLDLDAVERAERAMTPGPWRWGDWGATYGLIEGEFRYTLERAPAYPIDACAIRDKHCAVSRILTMTNDGAESEADAAGIVALRNAAPALIAEVRALRARLAEAKRLGLEFVALHREAGNCDGWGPFPEMRSKRMAAIAAALGAL